MPRYIDSDDAIYELERAFPADDFGKIVRCISRTPTADVVERKVGKWTERQVIEDGKAIEEWQSARCSVCGKYHTTPYLYYFDDFAYCPNCGAEMERGER